MRNEHLTKYQKLQIVLNAIYYIVSNDPINIYCDMIHGMRTVLSGLYPTYYCTYFLNGIYYRMVERIINTYDINVNKIYPKYVRRYAKTRNIQLFEPAYFAINFSSVNKP